MNVKTARFNKNKRKNGFKFEKICLTLKSLSVNRCEQIYIEKFAKLFPILFKQFGLGNGLNFISDPN